MNVLITAANSAQAHRLKKTFHTDNVILGDYHDLPSFMLAEGKMLKLPNPKSTAYTHEMLSLCLDNAIDMICVNDSNEAGLLIESKQLFEEYSIAIQITSDKIQ